MHKTTEEILKEASSVGKLMHSPFMLAVLVNESAVNLKELQDQNTKLVEAFNPRTWSKEMSDAWHKNIPDTQKAFQAILKEIGEDDAK